MAVVVDASAHVSDGYLVGQDNPSEPSVLDAVVTGTLQPAQRLGWLGMEPGVIPDAGRIDGDRGQRLSGRLQGGIRGRDQSCRSRE